jgi:chromosome partitioning protein
MARIVAVTNLKGGIGKTTTVVNVGAGLAIKGARVLLIDVDAQGNLAPALGVSPRRTLYEVLIDNVDPAKCITPARPNLDLIAGDDTLLSAQPILSRRSDWSRVLEQSIAPLKREYDFIFIDAPGSLTVLSVNALSASSDLLVPTTVESLSIKGLDLLFKQVARLKVSTNSIRLIVPTMFDARLRHSTTLLEELKQSYGALIASPIRVNVRLTEATSKGQTIFEYDPRSRGALDYAHLVDRLSTLWGSHTGEQRAAAASTRNGTPAATVPQNGPAARTAVPLPSQERAVVRPEPTRTESRPEHPAAPPYRADDPLGQPAANGPTDTPRYTCPHCGRPLRAANLAGYRVLFCDHCKYKQQELVSDRR